jgi:hypothetical protein
MSKELGVILEAKQLCSPLVIKDGALLADDVSPKIKLKKGAGAREIGRTIGRELR